MAFPSSSLSYTTIRDSLKNSIALVLDDALNKYALFTNSNTGNVKTDTAYDTGGGEVANANGYTTGGIVVPATIAISDAGGASDAILMFDSGDPSWSITPGSATARGMIMYADALAGNNPICYVNFGADYTATNGTFLVTLNANGLFRVDLTP